MKNFLSKTLENLSILAFAIIFAMLFSLSCCTHGLRIDPIPGITEVELILMPDGTIIDLNGNPAGLWDLRYEQIEIFSGDTYFTATWHGGKLIAWLNGKKIILAKIGVDDLLWVIRSIIKEF